MAVSPAHMNVIGRAAKVNQFSRRIADTIFVPRVGAENTFPKSMSLENCVGTSKVLFVNRNLSSVYYLPVRFSQRVLG